MTSRQYDVCVVGHVTRDENLGTDGSLHRGLGGGAFYAATALARLGSGVALITRMAPHDVPALREAIAVGDVHLRALPSPTTTQFRNEYRGGSNARRQAVPAVAAPFEISDLGETRARWFHLDPLTTGDMPGALLAAAAKRSRVSLDVQGFVRTVRDGVVRPCDWSDKQRDLRHVQVVKADLAEAQILTGATTPADAAQRLAHMGPQEVLITLGAGGAVIAAAGRLFHIAAIPPDRIVDPTGCGDSFCAGYLHARLRGDDIARAGAFAAAVASRKLATSGPFSGTTSEIDALLQTL